MRTKQTPKPSRSSSDSLEAHQEELSKGRSRATKRGRNDTEDVLGIVGMKMVRP